MFVEVCPIKTKLKISRGYWASYSTSRFEVAWIHQPTLHAAEYYTARFKNMIKLILYCRAL